MHIHIEIEEYIRLTTHYVPFEVLDVVEITELPLPKAPPAVVALADKLRARKYHRKLPPIPINLKAGINRIILEILADGKPHRSSEIKPALKANGFSPNSAGSRLQYLEKKRHVIRNGDGTWQLHHQVGSIPE
jgi:hypothetical protein